MKHINFTFLLTILMSMVGTLSSAHNIEVKNADGKTIYYNYANYKTELTVTYRGSSYSLSSYSGIINIPKSVTYNGTTYPVTSIGDDAFHSCSGLTSVTIPNSVTSIGDDAFRDCSGLTSIEIPNSVTSISSLAFYGCSNLITITVAGDNPIYDSRDNCNAIIKTTSNTLVCGCPSTIIPNSVTSIGRFALSGCSGLTSIEIPNSVTSIGSYAFYDCSNLITITVAGDNPIYDSRDNCNAIIETTSNTLVFGCPSTIIPNSVTSIGDDAFSGCSDLTSIEIPNSVTSIGDGAFSGCSGLTSIEIPNSVTSIGGYAFSRCSGLTSIEIPNSVTSIGGNAFFRCSGLTSIEIPNSVTSIVSYAFRGCSGLTSIEIPNSVTSIGDDAFEDCSGLTSIVIPNSVTSIGSSPFRGCSNLITITVAGDNPIYDSRDNCNAIIETTSNTLVCGCPSTIIPNSVTSIGSYAFRGCSGLTSIEIPNSVTSISSEAFRNCYDLTSIEIPNSVTSIGYRAFYDCSGLTSIEIPNSVTSIGGSAFSDCYGLTSVTIGNSVTSIGVSAFSGCSGLTSVTIGNSVTSIGSSAFSGCSGLTSITIPNSVREIGNFAFNDCSKMENLVIEDGNKTLTLGCSEYRSSYNTFQLGLFFVVPLKTVYVGREVVSTSQPPSSSSSNGVNPPFFSHPSLASVTIGENVMSIDDYAFYKCKNLIRVELNSSAIVSKKYSSSSSLELIFGSQVKEYVLGNNVTSIGEYAFSDCKGLTTMTIPNTVTTIGNSAFYNTNLKSLTIGTGLQSIGTNAFAYSSQNGSKPLKVVWLTNTPPEGYANANGYVNYVTNNSYTSLTNKKYYSYLGSMFTVDGIKYVPVSAADRTCDAIDCVYNSSAENTKIGNTVSYRGIDMTVSNINPYICYGNTFVKYAEVDCSNIDNYAFYGCTSLRKVDASNTSSIGNYAFKNCTSLQDINITNIRTLGNYVFQNCSNMTTAALGENLISIGDYAFSGCSNLQGVDIPEAVTSINKYTFAGCKSLTDMQIGSNVNTIDTYAFSGCSSLPSIFIPKATTNIGDYVFNECTSLKEVVMEDRDDDTVLALGSNGSNPLFYDCPLDSVYIGRKISYSATSDKGYSPFYGNTSLSAVGFNDNLTEIPAYAFAGCSKLKTVDYPESLKTIGECAFSSCIGFTEVVIPKSVTSLGSKSFANCTSMESFTVGSSVTSIGQEALSGCAALTNLVSTAMVPPVCSTNALTSINKFDCTLTIPQGTLAQYQAADQWKEFFFIEEKDLSSVNNITMDDGSKQEIVATYDLNGRKTTGLQRGMNIVKLKNGETRKVVIK